MQENTMRLTNGQHFPTITASRVGGGEMTLPQSIEGKWTVLLFYRGHWCPYCRQQLMDFQRALEQLHEIGAEVVALSVDPLEKAQETVTKHHLTATAKPRQVSVLLHPLEVGSAPLLWRDWSRRHQRRACLRLHRQRLEIQMEPALPRTVASSPPTISRAERAHYRLSWAERLARNARTDLADRITLTLFGIPERVATFLELATA
jgi:thiol-disulfide isomerase/thioredoxin